MRKNLLPITAGVLGSLALAVSASADFTGFVAEMKGTFDTDTDIFGGPPVGLVDVWNIYATFDNPDDSLNGIFVLKEFGQQMVHSSDTGTAFDGLGGGFWNWVLGGNTPLNAGGVYDLNPDAAGADTYLSIGLKAGDFAFGGDAAFFGPDHQAVLVASGIMNGSGVISGEDFTYVATPDDEQTYPDVKGRVLVLNIAVLSGENASGLWNIQWGNVPAGGGGQAIGAMWTTVPAPGALALLGLAGLAGARRRRRG